MVEYIISSMVAIFATVFNWVVHVFWHLMIKPAFEWAWEGVVLLADGAFYTLMVGINEFVAPYLGEVPTVLDLSWVTSIFSLFSILNYLFPIDYLLFVCGVVFVAISVFRFMRWGLGLTPTIGG